MELVCKDILNNKNNWTKMEGGISNEVFSYEQNNNKYIIKIMNSKNNNLFVIFNNFYIILENLETTLYIDKINNIIIEKFIEINIIKNSELFSKYFLKNIFNKIDEINLEKPNILKKNIIITYINLLTDYIDKNIIIINEIDYIKNVYNNLNIKIDDVDLVFCHNDLHKFNILYDNNNLYIIDWEYAGYTFKYFNHCNYVVLLLYQFITDYNNKILNDIHFDLNFYVNYIKIEYNLEKEYIKSLMLVSCYIWILWSYVKFDINKNHIYTNYKNILITIFDKILEL